MSLKSAAAGALSLSLLVLVVGCGPAGTTEPAAPSAGEAAAPPATQSESSPVAPSVEEPSEPDAPNPFEGPAPPDALARLGQGKATRVAVSPDGTLAAVASSQGVHLYRTDTLEQTLFLQSDYPAHALDFSPDGSTLAIGLGDNPDLTLLDIASGQTTTVASGHAPGQGLCGVAFSPDGRLLATSAYDDLVVVIDVQTGGQIYTVPGDGSVINVADFSPDGTLMAVAQDNGPLFLIDAASGARLETLDEDGVYDPVRGYGIAGTYGVAFSPDSSRVASGGNETVAVWNAQTGALEYRFKQLPDRAQSLTFSPDGRRLYAGTTQDAGRVWDMDSGELILSLNAQSIAASPDGDTFVAASNRDGLTVWDAVAGEPLRNAPGFTDSVQAIAYTPDGRSLLSGTYQGSIVKWDLESHAPSLFSDRQELGPTVRLAVSPDGKTLASGYGYGSVVVWDLESGEQRYSLEAQQDTVLGIDISPDGRLMATAGLEDPSVNLWDPDTGERVGQLPTNAETVYSLAFLDDNQLAVGTGGPITIWDVTTQQPLRTLSGHSFWVLDLAASPDGALLASASYDGSAALWDVASGGMVRVLDRSDQFIGGVAFSPDGQQVSTAYFDGTVRLWDVASGVLLLTLEGHPEAAWATAFSPDGQVLATGSWDGTIVLWDLGSLP